MADEIVSQLALDAQQVLTTVNQLVANFAKYTQSLQANAAAASVFNQGQQKVSSGIDQVNAKLEAQKQLASDVANQLRAAFQSGFANPTLAEIKRVNDAFANLQKTLVNTKASKDQIDRIVADLGSTAFRGADARIQSAIIAAQQAATGVGTSNAAASFKINEANVKAQAKFTAEANAKAQAEASANAARQLAGQFNTQGADPAALNRFQIAIQRFQQVAQNSKLSASQLSGVVSNLGQVFTGAEGKVATAALQVQKLGQALQGVTTTATGFGLNFQSIIQRFTFLEALRALNALQTAFSQAIPQAINFERQIAQIATIADKGDQNIDTLAVKVTDLANEFGKPAPEVAAGFYHALSNQVGDTSQTVQFLTEALKFSKAAVTDVGSAVDALSGVQNAYGQSSAQASHNADILFRTIDLGRVSAKELGDSFGRILPIAAQLGVSLEEVSAAISTATVQGVKFQDAQTQILNLLTAALKPTGDFKKRMNELGIETTNAGIAANGFVGFFSKIAEGAKSSEELAKLFPNLRGLRGEISLFADGGKKLTDFLDKTTESAGAAQKAFEKIQFSNAEQVSNELARIQNQITQGFGRDAVAILAELNKAFGGVANVVVVLGEALAAAFAGAVVFTAVNQLVQLVVSLSGFFITTAGTAATAGAAITTAAATSGTAVVTAEAAMTAGAVEATIATTTLAASITGIGLVAVAAAAITAGAFKLLKPPNVAAEFDQELSDMQRSAARFATDSANQVIAANKPILKALDEQVKATLAAEQEKQAAYNRSFQAAATLEKAVTDNFLGQLTQRQKAFTNFQNTVKKLEDDAAQKSKALQEQQNERNLAFKQQQFQNTLESKTPDQQATALNIQINRLLDASKAAFKQGDSEFSRKAIADAAQLAQQFEKITNNRILANKVNAADNALTKAIIDKDAEQVRIAQQLEKENGALVDQAITQLDLAKELVKQKDAALKASGGKPTDETAKLDKQISDAVAQVDAIGKKLNLGNLKLGDKGLGGTELQNAIDALRRVQQGPSLKFEFEKGLADVQTAVKKAFEGDAKVIELGLRFEPGALKDIQNQIADLKKQAKSGIEGEAAIPGAQNAVKTQADALDLAFEKFKKESQAIADRAKFQVPFDNPTTLRTGPLEDAIVAKQKQNLETLTADAQKLKDLLTNPANRDENGSLLEGPLRQVSELTAKFQNIQKAAADAKDIFGRDAFGSQEISDAAERIINSADQLNKASETLFQAQQKVQSGSEAQGKINLQDPTKQVDPEIQKLKEVERELNDATTSIGPAVQSATGQVTQSVGALANAFVLPQEATQVLTNDLFVMGDQGLIAGQQAASAIGSIGIIAEEQVPGVISLAEALIQLAEAEAAAGGGGGGGGEFASRGGYMQRFAGGGQARGTDTVHAMLTPGEIVMNPRASRTFFSQLMAMNSGVQPVFRSNGGSVGDTFGDINVNITANNGGDINARAIAKGIQREMRKGNLRRN